jgi:hypothetical protein
VFDEWMAAVPAEVFKPERVEQGQDHAFAAFDASPHLARNVSERTQHADERV